MKTLFRKMTGLVLAIVMVVSMVPVNLASADSTTGSKFTVDGKSYILMDAKKEIGGKTYYGVLSMDSLSRGWCNAKIHLQSEKTELSADNEVEIYIKDTRENNEYSASLQSFIKNFSPFNGYLVPEDTEWVMFDSTPAVTNYKTKIYFKGSVGIPTANQIIKIRENDELPFGDGERLQGMGLGFWSTYFYITNVNKTYDETSKTWTSNASVSGNPLNVTCSVGGQWYFMTYVDESFFCKNMVDDISSAGASFRNFLRNTYTKKELRAAGYTEDEVVSLGFPKATASATGIQLDKTELNVTQGTVDTIKSYVLPLYEAKNEVVHWSSSNTNIATVTNGKVMGRKEGTAIITATTDDGGFKATCTVNVIPGKVYYVSATDGDDENNNGSLDAPYATIQKAVDMMKPGEFVSVRGGNYRETVTFTKSGTATAPLTLMAYGDEEVNIMGTDLITDWTVDSTVGSNTVWKAKLDTVIDEKDMVFFNNGIVDYAKWPNNTGDNNPIRANYHDNSHPGLQDDWLFPTWGFIDSATGKPDDQSVSAKYFGTIYDAALPFGTDELIGATILSKPGEGWYMYTGEITDSDVGSFYIKGQMQFADVYIPSKDDEYYIYGSKVLLDYQNEWYCDDEGYIYIITPDGTDPNNASIEVKTRLNAIDLNENDYINVEGVKLFAGELDMQKSDNCNVTGITIDYVNNGPVMSGNDCRFAESTVRHSLNALMSSSGNRNKVINNLFEYGSLNGANAAVAASGLDSVIAYNTVRFTGSTGISLGTRGRGLFTYNDVSYYSIVCRDNGGFYGGHSDGINLEVSYNWAHDGMSNTTGGIYTDNSFQNIIIHHNVVWNSCWGYQTNAPRTGRLLYNNTFAAHTGTSWLDIDYSENNLAMNNIFTEGTQLDMYSVWFTGGTYVDGGGSSGRHFDSIFKEFNNTEIPKAELAGKIATDFVPQKGDEVIDAGVVIDNINEDYIGDAPDIGAYEYGGEIWVPGHNFEDKTLKDKEYVKVKDTKYANKVENTGFEVTGDLEEVTAWKKIGVGNAVIQPRTSHIFANNAAVHTGNNGVKFGSTDANATGIDGIQQTVTGLKPNTRYQLMAAGRIDDQTGANPITMTVTGATFPETTVTEPTGSNSLTINSSQSGQKDFLLVDVKEGRNGEKVYGLLSKDANDSARLMGIAEDSTYSEDGVQFMKWQSKSYSFSSAADIEGRVMSKFGTDMQQYMLLTDWEIREQSSSANDSEKDGRKFVVRSKVGFPTSSILSKNIANLNSPENVPVMDYGWYQTYYYLIFGKYNDGAYTTGNNTSFGTKTKPWMMTYVSADFFRNIPLTVSSMGDYVKYRLKTDFTQEELAAKYTADEIAIINAAPDATVTTKSQIVFDNYKWDERALDFVTDETGTVTINISKNTAGMGYVDNVTIYEATDTPVKSLDANAIPAYSQTVADSYTFEYDGKKFVLLEDGDGSNFIFCVGDYGKAAYDANNEQRFNPRDTDNIANMLNTSLELPANIKAHLETDHIWITEAGEKDNNAPINYEAKGGVALLSYDELLEHGAKISRTADTTTGAIGWWLRTGSPNRDEMIYVTSSDSRILSDINGSYELNVRPVIYLEDAFFTKVKLDTTKMGENVKKFLADNFTRTQLSKVGYTAEELNSLGSVLKPSESSNYVAAADGSFELLYNDAIVVGTETYIGFMLPVDYAGTATKKGTTLVKDNVDPLGNSLDDTKYGEFYMTASKEAESTGVSLDDTVIPTLPDALKNNLYLKEWEAGVGYGITGQPGMAKAKTYITLPSEAEFTNHAQYVDSQVLDNTCGITTAAQTHSQKIAALRTVVGYNARVYDAEAKAMANVSQGVQYVAGSVFPTFYVNADFLKETRLDLDNINEDVKALFDQLFIRDELSHLYTEEELDELGVTTKPVESSNYVAADDGSFELLYNDTIVEGTETYIGFMLPVDYAGTATTKGTTLVKDNVDPLGNSLDDTKYGEFYMTASNEAESTGVSLDDTVIPTLPDALKNNLYLKEWEAGVGYGITGQPGMAKAKTYITLPSEAEFTNHAQYVDSQVLDNTCGITTAAQTHSSTIAALRTVEDYNAKVYDAETKDFAKVSQGVQYVAGSVFPTFYVNADFLKETRLDLETINENVKGLFAQLFVKSDLSHLYTDEELIDLGVPERIFLKPSQSPNYVAAADGSFELLYNGAFVSGTETYLSFMLPIDYAGKGNPQGVILVKDNVDPLGNALDDTRFGEFYMSSNKTEVSSGVSLDDTVIPTLPKVIKDNLYLNEWQAGLAYGITGGQGMANAKTYITLPSDEEMLKHADYVEYLILDNTNGVTTSNQTYSTKSAALRTAARYNAKAYDPESKSVHSVAQGVPYSAGSVFPTFYVNAKLLKEIKLDIEAMDINVKNLFSMLFVRKDLEHLYTEEELDALNVAELMIIEKSQIENNSFTVGEEEYAFAGKTIEENGKKYFLVINKAHLATNQGPYGRITESVFDSVSSTETNKYFSDLKVGANYGILEKGAQTFANGTSMTALQNVYFPNSVFGNYLKMHDWDMATDWTWSDGAKVNVFHRAYMSIPSSAEIKNVMNTDPLSTQYSPYAETRTFTDTWNWRRMIVVNLNGGEDSAGTVTAADDFSYSANGQGKFFFVAYVSEDFFKNTNINVSTMGTLAQEVLRNNFVYEDMTGWSDANRDALFFGSYNGEGIGVVADKRANVADNTITVGVGINNNGDTVLAEGVKIVIAVYDGDNLENVKIVDLSKQVAANSVTSRITAQVPVRDASRDYTVKAMLWDSLLTAKPLCEAFVK